MYIRRTIATAFVALILGYGSAHACPCGEYSWMGMCLPEVPGNYNCGNPPPPPPPPRQNPNNYYVVHRYFCKDLSDNRDQGTCDITTYGASCSQAAGNQGPYIQQLGGDPCKRCGNNISTPYKYWSGSPDPITGGACQGW
jgi:hypothetical protein